MATREVRYRDEEYNVIIHLRQARVVEGMKRTQIIQDNLELATIEAKAKGEDLPEPTVQNLAIRVIRFFTYPACLAATASIENPKSYTDADDKSHPFVGKKLVPEVTLEEFMELPEAMVLMWEEAAYELNPHWVPQLRPVEPKEEEKEEPKEEAGPKEEAETDPGPD